MACPYVGFVADGFQVSRRLGFKSAYRVLEKRMKPDTLRRGVRMS